MDIYLTTSQLGKYSGLTTSTSVEGKVSLQGGGGEVSLRKSVVQSARQYDVMSRVRDFQNGEQSVHRGDR